MLPKAISTALIDHPLTDARYAVDTLTDDNCSPPKERAFRASSVLLIGRPLVIRLRQNPSPQSASSQPSSPRLTSAVSPRYPLKSANLESLTSDLLVAPRRPTTPARLVAPCPNQLATLDPYVLVLNRKPH